MCKTIDLSNGNCLSCYQGYVIEKGNCIILQVVTFPFCQTVSNGICQRCIQGYYTETPYQCSPVSILCRDYDQNTGNCLSCIQGYFLQIGQCVYPASGFDQNCITYDVSAFCSSCKPGYYLLNYICTLIDPYCVAFDQASQICNQCGGGKVPNGSKCKWWIYGNMISNIMKSKSDLIYFTRCNIWMNSILLNKLYLLIVLMHLLLSFFSSPS